MVPPLKLVHTGQVSAPGENRFPIIGCSPQLEDLRTKIDRVASFNVAVVITGETGSGKELVARELHRKSGREGEFLAFNCGAIPENLVESELFGHVKGAFSGAIASNPGYFMSADHGTLFLDEVAEMPLLMQVKLLRALDHNGEITAVGTNRARHPDVRVICATNKDLKEEMLAKRFREDLFYRLSVVVLNVPPLSERIQDVPLLVHHFLDLFNANNARQIQIDDGAIMKIIELAPGLKGNIRQLGSLVQGAAVYADDGCISAGNSALREAESEISVPVQSAIPKPVPAAITRDADAARESRIEAIKPHAFKLDVLRSGTLAKQLSDLGADMRMGLKPRELKEIVIEARLSLVRGCLEEHMSQVDIAERFDVDTARVSKLISILRSQAREE